MLKFISFFFFNFLLLSKNQLFAQVFTDSNLPIVIITTDGGNAIPDEPKIGADLKIVYRGVGLRNYLSDELNPMFLNYNGRIEIEIRGTASATFPQKPYGFETKMADDITNNNVSLLGMPVENDWILLATYIDKSLIRDYLAYNLARKLGDYAARAQYCEVVLNGQYEGIYILEEKIKRDKNRVDITELKLSDNSLDNISGGYLLQEDDDGTFTLPHEVGTANNAMKIEEPETPTSSQIAYIQNFMNEVDASTSLPVSDNFIDGYPTKLELFSFYNYFIINELFTNPDAYGRSTYYAKDRNGKLVFGPVWDFNSAGGNNQNGSQFWEVETGYFQGPKFLKRLFNSENFRCHLIKRWQGLRQVGGPLNTLKINAIIDSVASSLSEAQARHFERWPILGDCNVASAHPDCAAAITYQLEVDYLKNFLENKATWIDENIGLNFTNCSYPTTPNLVINEIMYNPFFTAPLAKKAVSNAVAEDYEFIEIKNNELIAVDLTGIYFRGGGVVYQFPANSTIVSGGIIVIASNAAEFEIRYGFVPFGQFTRDLSNTGENIILADGMGNEIDHVKYSNQSPWPNAYAKSIELKTSELDNTLPENWFQKTVNGGSPGVENMYVAPDPCAILPKIIINEINYNSKANTPPIITNTSDWIEIYNAENVPVDISGWFFKDATNTFTIPTNTVLAANDYLILCQNVVNFTAANTTNTKFLNVATGIGLSSTGEIVTIADQNNCIVDQLTYDEMPPWPTSPNGLGNTLSLKQPDLDNTLGENWDGSTEILGTPGAQNFAGTALPVRIISFEGNELENENKLSWKVADENNIEKYEIEYSSNAKSFVKIGEILAKNIEKYTFLHKKNDTEMAYYRLKIVENDGEISYSKVIAIAQSKSESISIYPNPASESITIELVNTNFSVDILDAKGKNVFKKANIVNKISISTKEIATGIYFVNVRSVDSLFNISRKVSILK